MDQNQLITVANEFLVAYYTNLVYPKNDQDKFYAENATILRPGMESTVGLPISEAKGQICYDITTGTEFSVLTYEILPIPEYGFNLYVTGTQKCDGETKLFNQNFTLHFAHERYFVVSDFLTIVNPASPVPTNVETVAVKGPKPKQTKKAMPAKQIEETPAPEPQQQAQPAAQLPRQSKNANRGKGRKQNDKYVYRP